VFEPACPPAFSTPPVAIRCLSLALTTISVDALPPSSSIPRPTPSSALCGDESLRLTDSRGDDLGHSLGFLVGQKVARAQDAALPAREPDLDERVVVRVSADPHVRVDTNDYSLDPRFVGRRVEVRVSQREVTAACLDTGELAARHERSFAKHRTITALEHARALRSHRRELEPKSGLEVQVRPLSVYDALSA
jgi:hypothetical protein